jgi:competence protein ComEC
MLIDTGRPESANQVVANLRYAGIERIDVLALTNNRPEHAGGLSEVLNSFVISEIWTNNVQPASDANDAYGKYITGKIPVKHPWQGDSIKLNGIKLTVLNPPNSTKFVGEDVNSIVLKIEDRGSCMMIMSDVTSSIEGRLISNNMNLTCNLLVLGNHGGGLSSDLLFIEKVFPDWNQPSGKRKPGLALISAGTEEANYPNSAVLEKLRLKNIPYVSTNLNGTIKVIIDSTGYNVITTAS